MADSSYRSPVVAIRAAQTGRAALPAVAPPGEVSLMARRGLREETIRSTFLLDSGNGRGQAGRRAWVTNAAGCQPRGRAGGAGVSGAMCAPNPAVIQVDPSSDTRRAS